MRNMEKIRNKLSEINADALLIADGFSREFAMDFASSAGMVLVTRKDAWFMVDFRYAEMARARAKDVRVLMTNKDDTYFALINRLCREQQVKTLLFEDKNVTVAQAEVFKKNLEVKLAPAGDLINRLRVQKLDFEIERLEKAQRVAEQALDQVCAFIRPGVRDIDIKAELEYRFIKAGCALAFDTIVAVGKNSSMPHAQADGTVVEEGDFVTVDLGARYQGYCSDMTRTFAVKTASDEMKNVYAIVLDAQLAALKAAKTGVPYPDVDKAARDIIEQAGYGKQFGHSLGHGVGIEVHEDLYASAADGGLKENSILTFEPGIYLEGKFGVRIEDFGVIRSDGVANLTRFPKELIIL